MITERNLTDEQQAVVERRWDTHLLVTAGAGAGKTFCLIRRLAFLIDDEGLDAADVLVLSFSRAAVREIRERLAGAGSAAQHVDVRTFDSYATWLLSEAVPDGDWQRTGYDARICAATRLLRTSQDAADLVGDLRHVVVDEVQDLVGDRAELVKALLVTVEGGFSLLGDPSQGIYGFQLADTQERLHGAATLYAWIRAQFGEDLTEATLSHNFRAREPETRVALPFGLTLARTDADYAGIHRDLRTNLLESDCLPGSLPDALPVIAEYAGTSTALLCRNNGEALALSAKLHEHGIAHGLQRSELDRVIPAWVTGLFATLELQRPSKSDVIAHLEPALVDDNLEPAQAWALLKRMDGNRGNPHALDLGAVRSRIAQRLVPDELVWQSHVPLVVSTIHRAKGLEFDHVIVVDPGEAGEDPVAQAEEARLLYVAMTRPRDLLLRLELPDKLTWGLERNAVADRWVKRHPGKVYRSRRYGMEIRGEDIHAEDPAGTIGFTSAPHDLQKYLGSQVHPGAPVSLTRIESTSDDGTPRYAADHQGVRIGVTSTAFSHALRQEIGSAARSWPERIGDLWIDCVETVAGSDAAARNNDMGRFGVWLRPRLAGLGRFVWPKKGPT